MNICSKVRNKMDTEDATMAFRCTITFIAPEGKLISEDYIKYYLQHYALEGSQFFGIDYKFHDIIEPRIDNIRCESGGKVIFDTYHFCDILKSEVSAEKVNYTFNMFRDLIFDEDLVEFNIRGHTLRVEDYYILTDEFDTKTPDIDY